MTNIRKYRTKKIEKMDGFEIQAIGGKILDYVERNKYELIFKSTKQICAELNVSHYKYKFYIEIYRRYVSEAKLIGEWLPNYCIYKALN